MFQHSVGVEIRPERIRAVCLKSGFKGVKLVAQSICSLEKDRPFKEKLSMVNAFITDFITENRISGAPVFIGVPSETALFREIEFPMAVKENLRTTIGYEIEKYAPFSAQDIHFDYQIFSEDKASNRITVLLMMVKKADFSPYEELANLLKFGISGIETAATAAANYVARHRHKNTLDHEVLELLKSKTPVGENNAEISPDLIPAFGLALKGLMPVPIRLNLLAAELRKKPSKTGFYVMLILIVLTLASGLAWTGSSMLKHRMRLHEINLEMKRLSSEVASIDRIQGSFKNLESNIEHLNDLRRNYTPALEVLRELTQILPPTAWIRELAYSEKGVQLDGEAESASELIPILENSLLFKDAVFLSAITKDKNGKERFRIGLKLEN